MILHDFHMMLYDYHLILYGFSLILYCVYLIFGGAAEILMCPMFSNIVIFQKKYGYL